MNDRRETSEQQWGEKGTAGATIAGQLTLDSVTRRFNGVAAVRKVSLVLKPGEVACLLGPSGCGKTTLLRIAAGIERPSSGRVFYDEIEVAGPSTFVPPEKRNIGLMFQDFALFPHLTLLDNVAFGLRRLARAEATKLALHGLERVGLASMAEAYPHNLSGGEQQRVALARAIVPRPQVMLMDEPFSGLDQRLRETVRAKTLELLRETRSSCLLVTHDPIEAMSVADRIFLMRAGMLIQSGTPEELYRQPVDIESARFFSDFNTIAGEGRGGAARCALGDLVLARPAPGGKLTVLIRPQGIRPALVPAEGFEALVTASRFLGDDTECQLLVQQRGVELMLVARIPAGLAPQRGESRWFSVDPGHVLAFPAA
jgi:iron(III) transport system ATP-binding protein